MHLDTFDDWLLGILEAYDPWPMFCINTCRLLGLQSIVGEEQCKHIVSEYLRRRGDGGPSDVFTFQDREVDAQREDGLHAYVKPKEDEIWSAGSKKTSKTVKQKTEAQASAPPSTQGGSCLLRLFLTWLFVFNC